ncbi:MAG: hypothetical protein K0S09_1754 [Sphingobacteriaceae bacterium]|jgi:hypothetical protein|nr:hypothetical protein [Sphingobacteriaceae bacterium]
MGNIKVDKSKFKFDYLPAYAEYLLKNKLEEFVLVNIRFCREVDLPMLKPLAKFSEQELVAISLESTTQMLQALADGQIADLIEINVNKWTDNKLEVIDKSEIAAEDLTLAYFIKRKTFSYFLYGYTSSAPIQQLVINDVDEYTTFEELISLKAYLEIHKDYHF